MSSSSTNQRLDSLDAFPPRHLGPTEANIKEMLGTLGLASLEALVNATVPEPIRLRRSLDLPSQQGEQATLEELKTLAMQNKVFRSFIGMGYYDCITPAVILRNVLENPAWYTQYTPYQAEIAQGRLEALLNFQTVVSDLTGLPLANASLLDEATAAGEAMSMCQHIVGQDRNVFLVADDCHPQTIAVLQTRAKPLGITVHVGNPLTDIQTEDKVFGVLVQYPNTNGALYDYHDLAQQVHQAGALMVVATDLLALTLFRPPGEFGADIALGSSQRFGVPMGFGGPHAAFFSTKEEYKRQVPGRMVGVSRDTEGHIAYRLALQTREQHIRRDRATSNICTAQVLLANVASMYAVYHGPEGLRQIANRVHTLTAILAQGLQELGCQITQEPFFDTIRVMEHKESTDQILAKAKKQRINLRPFPDGSFGISLDETTTTSDIQHLLTIFSPANQPPISIEELSKTVSPAIPSPFARTTPYLTHEVFNRYHSEHELLRYLHQLQTRDLSLVHSMIPLGSCTMKLNATAEMVPITWPEFNRIHPFAPKEQTKGYEALQDQLKHWLAEITGFAAVSLQPNAGSQGEYAGLMTIRAYHEHRGQTQRDVCLIPASAHGTNPASAVIAGMKVVPVECDQDGNIDLADLEAKASEHHETLAALMITYPSTHGVFEETVVEVCRLIHKHGGQVYMDGANMNAMVGICRPGDMGADVCHLNLHKTFCIPHGGGGPGMGPIGVAAHLAPFLPGHPIRKTGGKKAIGPIAAAPYGSPSILPISWAFIRLMGKDGLTTATQVAILNANYMAKKLEKYYSVLYTGKEWFVCSRIYFGSCAHLRRRRRSKSRISPNASWIMGFTLRLYPGLCPGTMMIEPTESESKAELDRYCEALILIRKEIADIEEGRIPKDDNPLKNAPHTIQGITSSDWQSSLYT